MGKCFILPKHVRECEGCRHSGVVWENCQYGKKMQIERAAPALYEALTLLLSNWPPDRDGMDHEILPVGVKAGRAALALVDGEEVQP